MEYERCFVIIDCSTFFLPPVHAHALARTHIHFHSPSHTYRYPIELLKKAEDKLVDLLENLDRSCDLEEVTRNMEEEEFHHNIEGKFNRG